MNIIQQITQNVVQQIQAEEDKKIFYVLGLQATSIDRHSAHRIVHLTERKKRNLVPGDPVQHQHDSDSYGVIISIELDLNGNVITVLWSRAPFW